MDLLLSPHKPDPFYFFYKLVKGLVSVFKIAQGLATVYLPGSLDLSHKEVVHTELFPGLAKPHAPENTL